ncbi:MAG: DMT family transporter [Clostridia bacterium]|nr:DMT family transporter [Clostridia bacterium]
MKKEGKINDIVWAYGSLVFVIFIWGTGPLLSRYLLQFYAPTIYSAFGSLVSGIGLFFICLPHLKKINRQYFKIALPTGLFVGLASLLQKIGLQYTTPAQYAFLENLSCVSVPVLLFIFIRKKPKKLTVFASVLCLVGTFVLSGLDFSSGSVGFGKGEILCAVAGILYGVNIAGTGAFAKKLYAPLYVMIQVWVQAIFNFCVTLALHFIKIDGIPIEPIVFSWEMKHILLLIGLCLISSTLCWILRTSAMKYVDASVVAIMMPFSAVITGLTSVIFGADPLTLNLLVGAGICLIAALLSGISDVHARQEENVVQEQKESGS